MNRKIKFRARNNKCWIYFDAIINGWVILNENGGMAKINPETVGQYTGLHDKNGKEIYEGDIVTNRDKNIKYIVEWYDTGLRARQYKNKSYIGLEYWKDVLEVIGNIYDNPELLEGE